MAAEERLPDGSAIVQVLARDDEHKKQSLRLREIQAQGVGVNGKSFTLRLWTSLLDFERYPAEDLARERWEHKLYHRELKLDVRSGHVRRRAVQFNSTQGYFYERG